MSCAKKEEKTAIERISISPGKLSVQTDTVFCYPLHIHTCYEMLLYQPFDGCISVNEHRIRIDSLTAVLISPFDFHKVDVKDSCHAQFIKITFEESCLCLPPPEASMLLTHLEPNTLLPNLFADAYTHREDETYLSLVLNALVLRLTKDGAALKNHITAPGTPLAAKALRRINEQFPAVMSLQQLARELSVTPEHLSRVFKAYIGMGFCQYTNALKLCHAATLLCETSATVTEIGYACGYENLSHFLRCFKEKYGTTPKHYRAQQAAISKHGCPIGGHPK